MDYEFSKRVTRELSCAMAFRKRMTDRASKSCRRADACLRKIFEHLRKICIFECKTGKTGTFYDFGTI